VGVRRDRSASGARTLSHSAPLRFAIHTLLVGGSVLLAPRFEPAEALSAIEEYRPTTAFCAPTHLKRLGRREDLIITGGVNVYPVEVERVLNACPGVRDSAVFGVDDERWGQRVCAAVVGTATPDEIAGHARARLAPAKRPKDYYSLPELPTFNGKLSRRAIRTFLGLG
jgi:acyl-CoA synthetase (AMP-forming)/AMP-acid ligase II